MGIREALNARAELAAPAIAAVIVAVVAVSVWNSHRGAPSGPITRGYFSDDDGKTYFADDVYKPVPFDHNGKQAFRAYVFRCGSGKPFVGYLGQDAGREVKKPGETKWVPATGAKGDAVTNVTCPEGGTVEAVLP